MTKEQENFERFKQEQVRICRELELPKGVIERVKAATTEFEISSIKCGALKRD